MPIDAKAYENRGQPANDDDPENGPERLNDRLSHLGLMLVVGLVGLLLVGIGNMLIGVALILHILAH